MSDMLVKLYELPDAAYLFQTLSENGVEIRYPKPWDKTRVIGWVAKNFSDWWAWECEAAFRTMPPSCFIAVEKNKILGFACHDCTAKNFFGPMGVVKKARGRGIGKALLLAALGKMKSDGYGYAIIGAVGPVEFYGRTVGATVIDNSTPGVYTENLR